MVNRGILGDIVVALFGEQALVAKPRWYHQLRRSVLAIARTAVIAAVAMLAVWACMVAIILLGRLL